MKEGRKRNRGYAEGKGKRKIGARIQLEWNKRGKKKGRNERYILRRGKEKRANAERNYERRRNRGGKRSG